MFYEETILSLVSENAQNVFYSELPDIQTHFFRNYNLGFLLLPCPNQQFFSRRLLDFKVIKFVPCHEILMV